MIHRRITDNCWVKRQWDRFTPYVQVWGWLIVAVPAIWGITVLAPKAEAFDGRLTVVEQQNVIVNQKLDLVIQLLGRK